MYKPHILSLLLLLSCSNAYSLDLDSGKPLTISQKHSSSIFHHLESGGRKSIAINKKDVIGIVWEDNSNGENSVYYVDASPDTETPSNPIFISAGYSPVITSHKDGFIIACENDTTTIIFLIDSKGNILAHYSLGDHEERQIYFDDSAFGTLAIWVYGDHESTSISSAEIKSDKNNISISNIRAVDSDSPLINKNFPSIVALSENTHIVSWQDYRTNTNVLRYALFDNGAYSVQKPINATIQKSEIFGHGSSAMRGALASIEDDQILAVWLDKRAERSGYEVYSSISSDLGKTFGKNTRVQDIFGSELPQWNASIIPGKDVSLVLWNDARENDQDVFYSYLEDGEWSDDVRIESISGTDDEYSPSAVFDSKNNLHIVWLQKTKSAFSANDSITSVKYTKLPIVSP